MMPLINTSLAMIIALAFLLEFLALPFLVLWLVLSIRRSLARIADSLDQTTTGSGKKAAGELQRPLPVVVSDERHVSNSIFGR